MAATALSGRAASSQIVNTVEASAEAASKQLQSVLESDRLRENLEDYVSKLRPARRSSQEVSNQALSLLGSAMPSAASSELFDIIKSATPEDLTSGKLRERLTQILGIGQAQNGGDEQPENGNGEQAQSKQGVGLRERTLKLGTDALLSTLVGRGGLSNLNVEGLTKSLNSLVQPVMNQASQSDAPLPAVIRADVEHYLLNSPFWYLQPEALDRGFREVLYDPDADVGLVWQQLEQLNRGDFVSILRRREGLTLDQTNDIADELEVIRREVLDTVRVAEEERRSQELRHQVEAYLGSVPKEALTSERIQEDFPALLADPEATYETVGNRLIQFDRDTLMQMLLAKRQDLSPEETEQILNDLESARDRFLNQSQETWNQLQAQASDFRQQVETYLRETNSAELTPASFQQTLQSLLDVPKSGVLAARVGLGQLDRNDLEQVLAQRQDLDPEQVNQLIDQVESVRHSIVHKPQELAGQAKEQYDRLLNKLTDYLSNTNLEELNPEGIQRDLQTLLDDPQAGTSALRGRLAQVDRETLVKLLSQREDLSEEQINQVIDRVQNALRTLVRAPQTVVTRTRDRIQDFQTDLADYLRHTKREELNPEGIQRDLQLLIKQPRVGVEQLSDRLSHLNRDTLVALLSQREDISSDDANQIAEQIFSVREKLVAQARNIKDQAQSAVDNTVGQVRNYLNSLEQPELNYDSIQRDIRKLFDDPEAGLDALRDRLSQFDRETLVAILSSRSDISEEQANRIIDQIESVRDSVLHRAERLQAEAEKRIKALKHQAKEQVEDVQKTIASAAWWLFGTAVTSVAAAAIAGVLASGGFNF